MNYKTFVLKCFAWKCPDSTSICASPVSLPGEACPWNTRVQSGIYAPRLTVFDMKFYKFLWHNQASVLVDLLKEIGWSILAWRRHRSEMVFPRNILNGHRPSSLLENMPTATSCSNTSSQFFKIPSFHRVAQLFWKTGWWSCEKTSSHGYPARARSDASYCRWAGSPTTQVQNLGDALVPHGAKAPVLLPSSIALWNKIQQSVTSCTSPCFSWLLLWFLISTR